MSHPRQGVTFPTTRLTLLFALVASAIGLFWHWMGRPVAVPASPLAQGQKLNCLSYAPFHDSRAPHERPLHIPDGRSNVT
jgi:hypothetical protein